MLKKEQPNLAGQEKSDLAYMEAALYVAGRPLDLRTLGSIVGTRSEKKIQKLARTLMKENERRGGALEILELGDKRFVMQLKAEYTPKARRLAIRPLLNIGPLKTLSYIAYQQPVLTTQVIQARGSHAYSHIKELKNMGLISLEKTGRTNRIQTTDFFADYFGLSHDMSIMKRQLKSKFKEYTNSKK